jgi:hypothetical protein
MLAMGRAPAGALGLHGGLPGGGERTSRSAPMHNYSGCSGPRGLGLLHLVSNCAIGVREARHLLTKHHNVIPRMTADGKNLHAACLKSKDCGQRPAQTPKQSESDAGTPMHRPLRRLIHYEQQLIICAAR